MKGPTIAGIGAWVPEGRVRVERVAAAAGLDALQLRTQLGFEGKHAPQEDVAPFFLALHASRAALADAGVAPGELDLVLTVGRSRAEYLGWSLSLAQMKELGAVNAVGLDMCDSTGGTLLSALRVVAAKFAADPRRQVALVAVHQRLADMVDTANADERWLWPIGDGGAALVVRRGGEGPGLHAHAFAHEGRTDRLLRTRWEIVDEGPNPQDFFHHEWANARFLTLRDGDRWFANMVERASRRLPETIERAVSKAGLRLDQVAAVQAGYLPPAVAEATREALALGSRLRTHNAHGLLGGAELGFALQALRRDPSLRGQPVVVAGMGFPASYGAYVMRF